MSHIAAERFARISTFLRAAMATAVCLVAIGGSANASILVGSSVYTNVTSSSNYNGVFTAAYLFDNDLNTEWAIDATNYGTNPQGQDQGWVKFTFDRVYTLTSVSYAPREASGAVNGTDSVDIWISSTPFAVDVTNATQTANFVASNPTTTKTISSFANNSLQSYSFISPVTGRYVLARFLNATDADPIRNLGGREMLFSTVPEPSSLAVFGVLTLASLAMRRRGSR